MSAHPTNTAPVIPDRVTLRTLRKRVRRGEPFPMISCYDATSARWFARGGIDAFLVGDTAAQMLLGHDTTLPAAMPFMLEITAAVRRGAPNALIMADMPFGSYQTSDERAMDNAIAFLKQADADCVKLEVDAGHAQLIDRMTGAGIPVVAHLGAKPQHVRAEGGYRRLGKTKIEVNQIVDTAELLIQRGAAMILLEAVTDAVSERVVAIANDPPNGRGPVPVIGCGAGNACHGQVLVMHDIMGLSDWQPPFAPPLARIGELLENTAARWAEQIRTPQPAPGRSADNSRGFREKANPLA